MRITLTVFILILISRLSTTYGQVPDEPYQFFDASWKPVKEKKAFYLLRKHLNEDTCWEYCYYNIHGPLVRVETYRDKQGTVRRGLFAWYNEEGQMDSSGYYFDGLPDKDWTYLDPGGKLRQQKHYDKGRILTEKEFQVKLKGTEIIDRAYPDFSRLSAESYFPGGDSSWHAYLNKNLNYPKRAVDNLVQGTVVALFRVDPTGEIHDIQILRSLELSLDDETKRIITGSSPWVPAVRDDRKLRSYKVQPVHFKLQGV